MSKRPNGNPPQKPTDHGQQSNQFADDPVRFASLKVFSLHAFEDRGSEISQPRVFLDDVSLVLLSVCKARAITLYIKRW